MDDMIELSKNQFEQIEKVLNAELMSLGLQNVLLIDLAGNILVSLEDGKSNHDVYSLAALAAGNFGTVSAMAELIGEKDFSLLFHKGETESIHFSRIADNLLLISIFGKDISLGFLRLKVAEASQKIHAVIDN